MYEYFNIEFVDPQTKGNPIEWLIKNRHVLGQRRFMTSKTEEFGQTILQRLSLMGHQFDAPSPDLTKELNE